MSLSPPKSDLKSQALEDTVMDLILATLDKKSASLKPDDPLFSGQARFDSFSLMEFVLRLEEAFGISIPDEDLDPDIFYSVKTIVAYVQRRLEKVN
jgi:acyl carrier protein